MPFQRNLHYAGACCPGDFLLRNQQYVRRIVVENMKQREISSFVKDLVAQWRKRTYLRKELTRYTNIFRFVDTKYFQLGPSTILMNNVISKPAGLISILSSSFKNKSTNLFVVKCV